MLNVKHLVEKLADCWEAYTERNRVEEFAYPETRHERHCRYVVYKIIRKSLLLHRDEKQADLHTLVTINQLLKALDGQPSCGRTKCMARALTQEEAKNLRLIKVKIPAEYTRADFYYLQYLTEKSTQLWLEQRRQPVQTL